jgi:hypothetical protein
MDVSTREQWMSIAEETVRSYVRREVRCTVAFHQDFQGRCHDRHLGMDPNPRDQHIDEPWYELARNFADTWDQKAFDPDYQSESPGHLEPMVHRVFARAKSL